MVKENLPASYRGDENARDKMHVAQCLAGMAFSNALLGICHSMAHKTGAVFGIPHGCANGIYLPYVIAFNRKNAEAKYAQIARYIGLEGNTDKDLCDAYVNYIKELNKQLNIPATLQEYGVDEEKFKAKLETIAKNAALDACTFSNPRETSADDFQKIFTAAYYGTEVDF